jgi:hypothetical protein
MRNQLEKAIDICKKTGDRLIVFDNIRSDSPFVVMNLDEYEKLVLQRSEIRGLTEEELLDKINRDIALWKSNQPSEEFELKQEENERFEPEMAASISMEEAKDDEADISSSLSKNRWAIKSEIKEGAEEIIEEDRHYLEEVRF